MAQAQAQAHDAAEVLRDAMSRALGDVDVALHLSHEQAEQVLRLLELASSNGALIVPIRQEFTTNEAAALLEMSRPSLMKLLDAGVIRFRKVGSHHRIPVSEILAFQRRRDEEHQQAVDAMAEFSNRVGFTD